MNTERDALRSIQVLRGLAATSVVVAHAATQFPKSAQIPGIGAAEVGVDVFFVISGFIMVYVTTMRPQTSGEFFLNRIIRIVPNYWFYTVATAALAVVYPALFRGTSFDSEHLALSLLFVAHQNPALVESTSPLLRVGWTLNYEMFFYVIFSAALFVKEYRVVVSASIIVLLVLVGSVEQDAGMVWRFYTQDIMLEFVYGMVLAVVYLRGFPRIPEWALVVAIVAAVSSLLFASYAVADALAARGVIFGLPALVIVASCLALEGGRRATKGALFAHLGDASYTIYLFHPFCVTLCRFVSQGLGLVPDTIFETCVFLIVSTVSAVALGCVAYRIIEAPLTRWTKGLLGKGRMNVERRRNASAS